MSKYVFINDAFIPENEARLHISDLSFQRGYGIFDFLKTLEGSPIFLEDHFHRFYHSAAEMGLEVPYDRQTLQNIILELMKKNDIPYSGIKFLLSGGYSEDGYQPAKPNLVIQQSAFTVSPSQHLTGLKLMTTPFQRQLASVKTIDYLQAIRLQPVLKKQGADDLLYIDHDFLRECPRANLFLIRGNDVLTPRTKILKGITRSKILDLKIDGLSFSEEELTVADLKSADEIFITSSTKNVCAVISVDGQPYTGGKIGPKTKTVSQAFEHLLETQYQNLTNPLPLSSR